ncbi:SprB repeat-containing protein, partial [Tenacibaculum geojense]
MKRKILLILLTFLAFFQIYAQEKGNLFDDSRVSNELKQSAKQLSSNKEKSEANKLVDTPFTNRLGDGGINVKGNITFVGNNILSIDDPRFTFIGPNDDFNYNGNSNTDISLGYIDIDDDLGIPGNNTTFSSSMSSLNLPSCSRVVYAGLYWAAIYPYDNWSDESSGVNTRDNDFNTMKFKLPGQNYQDITGTIIYDDGEATQLPYLCYSDVTSLVQSLANPNGDYFGANIKATLGRDSVGQRLGSSAGWVMVVIYENDTESSKNVSLFDGFSTIDGVVDTDVNFSGFTTIPTGPVRVQLLTAALEGDKPFVGDSFQIRNQLNNYQDITTGANNPANNFFNSSISKYNNLDNNRLPRSTNTLGFDIDLFTLNNPSNSVISNGQTSIDVRFTTAQDAYFPFLNAMTVEIIEPRVQLVKTIDDGAGNDLQGADVTLGSELYYDISFQNVGTDDATNTIITDILPKNVDLLTTTAPNGHVAPDGTRFDIDLPPGVTIAGYDPPSALNGFRAELRLAVDDSLVEENGAEYHIRMHVQVVSDCNELRDVCSNVIENQAFAQYEGVQGGVVVNDEPSFAGIDACDFGVVGSSNFLVNVDNCSYERDVVLCGPDVTLTAGSGFETYEWYDSANNLIGNTQSITVTQVGTYTVVKTAPASSGCISTDEVINVIPFGSGVNPVTTALDNIGASYTVQTCPNDNSQVVEIYLCGDSDSVELATGIIAPTTVRWQQLSASCSPDPNPNCPTLNNACWEDVPSQVNDPTRIFTDSGQYRLEVTEQGGCFGRFYFNIYKASVTPVITTEDIICGNPGNITITGVPSNYEFAIVGAGDPAPADSAYQPYPGGQTTYVETITTAGTYDVYIRNDQTSCVYYYPNYNVASIDIDVDVSTNDILCFGGTGEVIVQINSAIPGPYTYTLSDGASTVGTFGPTSDRDHTFNVSSGGNYTLTVTTDDCSFTDNTITFTMPDELVFNVVKEKDIDCTDGVINLTSSGGTGAVSYAILSYVPASTATDPAFDYGDAASIPVTNFFNSSPYTVASGSEGTYEFVAIDENNCVVYAPSVEVLLEPELQFNENVTPVSCSGTNDGTINISVDGSSLGYTIEYSIDGGTNYNFTGSFTGLAPGDYTITIRATKNGNQCDYTISPVNVPAASTIDPGTVSLTQDYTCNTLGQITFSGASGGTGTIYYGVNGSYSTDLIYNNLTDGDYVLSVRDDNGCPVSLGTITIDPLPVIPDFTDSVTYNCDGTGNVTLTPPATPVLTYEYSLDGGTTTQVSNVFSNLPVGDHTITVLSPRACPRDFVVNIAAGQEFGGSIVSSTNVSCNGGS